MNHHLTMLGRNSLLTEFSLQAHRGEITVTPYHAHALHQVETREQLIIGRPAIIAHRTASLLAPEIQELEHILAQAAPSESVLQKYLEEHPEVLYGLGYRRIYGQIVLEREDGTALRPDFFLEPVAGKWWDILDIKVPDMKVVVGGRDRKAFSASVTELLAQLREYEAYFEDPRLAKRVEDVYGIKCYRPRLIGIIGRNPRDADERQLRRLMTHYADTTILTFDELLALARQRLLV
jgi:hypothetical protein